MCRTCGCTENPTSQVTDLKTGRMEVVHHEHRHESHPGGAPAHRHAPGHIVDLKEAILGKNDLLAAQNRGWLLERRILALNVVSAPGAGKTAVLERTIRDLGPELPIQVIEGDQETANDAQRIESAGCRVVQINTGAGCHLDAQMVHRALDVLHPLPHSIVMIENVGNLVCPALFDLGEAAKVIVLSVTEGEDKPLKYPHMFRAARLMLLNKVDLLPFLKFDVARCIEHARTVNPALEIMLVSALSGEGMPAWYDWLRKKRSGWGTQ